MEYDEFTTGPATAKAVASPAIAFLKANNPDNEYFAKCGMFSGEYGDTIKIKEKASRGIRKFFPRTIAKIFYAAPGHSFLSKFKTYDAQLISAKDLERLTSTEEIKRARDCILLNTHTTV